MSWAAIRWPICSPLRSGTRIAPVAAVGGHRRAVGAPGFGEPPGVWAGDAHAAAAAGGHELVERRLADRAAAVDDDDVVGGLGDLGEHVAGDEHGAALGGE